MIGDLAQDLYNWVPVVVLVAYLLRLILLRKLNRNGFLKGVDGSQVRIAVNETYYSLCASSATRDRADYLKYNPVVLALYSRHADNSLE